MKRLKKLLSVVLAGAMALSLCATALADDPAATPPVSTVSGDTLTTVSGDKVGSGEIEATSMSQGAVPAKPISVILPVIPERTSGRAQLFDFILDPHQLISGTDAARYLSALSGAGDADTLFDPNTRLYFASKAGADYLYSGSSKVLTVTNTGFVPVDVDLDLEFDRGSAKFDLVASKSALNANLLARPEMYLAVVASGQSAPIAVLDPADNAGPTVKYTSTSEYLKKTTDVLKPVFEYDGDNYDSEDDTATYYAQSVALDDALEDVAITLTFNPHDNGADNTNDTDDDGVAYIEVGVTGVPNTLAYGIGDANGDEFSVSSGGAITDPIDDAISEEDAGADGAVITVTIGTKDNNGDLDEALGVVTFAVTVPSDPAEPEGTQTLTLRKPHTGATVETALDVLADSYKLAHTTDSTTLATLDSQGVDVTDAGYYWEKQETNDAAYPAFSFHLEGDINEANRDNDAKVSPWDNISAASNVVFEMTWDVTPYSKFAARTKLTDPADDAGAADPLPTVVVTDDATGTGTSTKYATLTWTAAASGKYASCQPTAIKSGNAAASTISFTKPTATTLKLTATSTNKNSKCVVTFSDGTNSVDVEVDGWYTGT